jgi:phosphopantothenoylcysteine decarboxylase/phosphopantothenate--cysteine ligase
LARPQAIVAALERVLGPQDLKGLHVLVTAGGTREPIDAVRVIANRSSGKQGYAIAAEAAARGAAVTLVTTVDREAPYGVEIAAVETAAQMEAAVGEHAADADVVIMAAAVADFRPVDAPHHKIKKDTGIPQIVLEPTPDILAALGRAKRPGQVLVGFAAETDDVLANARRKLERKQVDLLVANDVLAPGSGFQYDTNQVTILSSDGDMQPVPLSDKRAVANAVLDAVVACRRSISPLRS